MSKRIMYLLIVFVVLATGAVRAQEAADPCADSLHPLLSVLSGWLAEEQSDLSPGYAALGSGAALTVAYTAADGFSVPLARVLLWPGDLFSLADSQYAPVYPFSLVGAQEQLLRLATAGHGGLIVSPQPVYIYAVDTSFGDPWFFATRCALAQADTSIWDQSDFRRHWWLWRDEPGVNVIWPRPDSCAPALGRSALYAAMRNSVLSARPDSSGSEYSGLAAFEAAIVSGSDVVGDPGELHQLAACREVASAALLAHQDLWRPDDREPVKLAAYYLQKDAAAWRALADQAEWWPTLEAGARDNLLTELKEHETNAALALDQLVTQAAE
jgi:hypothetical protein